MIVGLIRRDLQHQSPGSAFRYQVSGPGNTSTSASGTQPGPWQPDWCIWKARYITGKSCESCLAQMDPRSPFRYCPMCSDWDGPLYPREIVRNNVAIWMQAWQADISYEQAVTRAGYFMSAMGAWAEGQGAEDRKQQGILIRGAGEFSPG